MTTNNEPEIIVNEDRDAHQSGHGRQEDTDYGLWVTAETTTSNFLFDTQFLSDKPQWHVKANLQRPPSNQLRLEM